MRGGRITNRRRARAGRTPGGAQPVGELVRAVHARTAGDGRVPTTGGSRRDGGDGAPRRERDGGVAAVGGARCSATDVAGRSTSGRDGVARRKCDASDGGPAAGR